MTPRRKRLLRCWFACGVPVFALLGTCAAALLALEELARRNLAVPGTTIPQRTLSSCRAAMSQLSQTVQAAKPVLPYAIVGSVTTTAAHKALHGAPGAGAASGVPGGAGAGAAAQGAPPAWRLGLAVPGVTVPAGDALPLWLATAAALAVHEAGALPPGSALSSRYCVPCTISRAPRLALHAPDAWLACRHLPWRTACLHAH